MVTGHSGPDAEKIPLFFVARRAFVISGFVEKQSFMKVRSDKLGQKYRLDYGATLWSRSDRLISKATSPIASMH